MTQFSRTFTVAMVATIAAFASPRIAAADTVWLSSLDISKARQGYGTAQVDQSIDRHPMIIAGKKFDHGFGTHSISTLRLNLNAGTTKFHAFVGIDDEVGPGKGSADFQVIADGKPVWNSGVMKYGQAAKSVDVDLTGVKMLVLRVGDGGNGFDYDHADWADAQFEVSGDKPQTVELKASDPTIDMSRPNDMPAIHTPLTYGSVTGTPLLWTIAATGKAPLSYEAIGLPKGLKLDAVTGIISGTVQTAAEYPITLQVKNAIGKASQNVNFKIGQTIALTPPLGWNSYDGYGDNVTEAEIRANAEAVAKNLKAHGWEYVVVDFRWYDPGAHDNNPNGRANAPLVMDAYGRLLPAENRFPSAANGKGFKSLAADVHAMGLKFGIHIMRGIPRNAVKANLPILGSKFTAADAANTESTCPWCPDMYGVRGETPAGQAYYNSLFQLYAEWGLDFVKVDDLSRPYSTSEVEAIRKAIDKCGRTIVFSTSPGATPLDHAGHVASHANMWRMMDDFWDSWGALSSVFDVAASWNGHAGPGHWPDADMLPLGHLSIGNRSVGKDRQTRFTKAEQVSMMTLWSLAPAPLMLGGNFADADPWEIALLTNDEILAVNQDPLGRSGGRVSSHDGLDVWERDLADGSKAVALFNRTDEDASVGTNWSTLVLVGRYSVRDLWQHKDLGNADGTLEALVPAHGAVFLRLSKARTAD